MLTGAHYAGFSTRGDTVLCHDPPRSFFAGPLAFRAAWQEGYAAVLTREKIPSSSAEQKDTATIKWLFVIRI